MERIPAAFRAATLNPAEEVDLKRFLCDEYLDTSNLALNRATVDLAVCYVGNATPENRRWFLELLAPRMYCIVVEVVMTRSFDNTLVNKFNEADVQAFFVPDTD
jgi:hypothetical protein